jgi:hypothetical protein
MAFSPGRTGRLSALSRQPSAQSANQGLTALWWRKINLLHDYLKGTDSEGTGRFCSHSLADSRRLIADRFLKNQFIAMET